MEMVYTLLITLGKVIQERNEPNMAETALTTV